MSRLFKYSTLLLLSICMSNSAFAQLASSQDDELPMAFIIGEHEDRYEKMVESCNTHLLNVCEGSMEDAYYFWLKMLDDIETYAAEKDFEINGIKIWMTVYWNYDGSIKHIVYYPKPNSRNMDFEELTEFFDGFSKVYKFPKQSTSCFSHYGSASFPSYSHQDQGN